MKNRILFVFVSVFISISCVQRVTDTDCIHIAPINTTSPINIDISELVDSITYVQLETNQRCLLGLIDKVVYADNHLFVKCQNGLFMFEQDGTFVSEIGKRGRGPSEYLHIDTFFIDEQNCEVAIICSNKKRVLYYGYDGQYIRSSELNNSSTGIIHYALNLQDGSILVNYKLSSNAYPADVLYERISLNSSGSISDPILPSVDLATDKDGINSYLYSPMAEYKSEILALLPISNLILLLEKGRLNAKYKVMLPSSLPDNKFIKKQWKGLVSQFVNSAISAGFSPGIQGIYSSDGYLFLKIGNNTVVWDGYDSMVIGNVSHRAVNVAGGAMLSGVSDNSWGVYEAGFLLDTKDKIKVPQMSLIIDRLSYESNPVVFRYHFKEGLVKGIAALK